MIHFAATGTVTATPRNGSMTTEFRRRYWEEHKGEVGIGEEWVEPNRVGIAAGGVPYTVLRIKTDGIASEEFEMWVQAPYATKTMFDRAVGLEVGDRVRIKGQFTHDNTLFRAKLTKVQVLG